MLKSAFFFILRKIIWEHNYVSNIIFFYTNGSQDFAKVRGVFLLCRWCKKIRFFYSWTPAFDFRMMHPWLFSQEKRICFLETEKSKLKINREKGKLNNK